MLPKRAVFWSVLAVLALVVGVQRLNSPHRILLPANTTDTSSIQAKLDRLSPGDRDLVRGYLQRSGGRFVPPGLADPNEPFTARTVGEAIALQRKFLAEGGSPAAASAPQDEARTPLQAAVALELLQREIRLNSRAFEPAGAISEPPDRDDHPVLVSTYRLTNQSGRTIASVAGQVVVRKAQRMAGEDGVLDRCRLTHGGTLLQPGQSVELSCDVLRFATAAEHAYAAMPDSALEVRWEPREIRFPDGSALTPAS